jgi:hypothetical protein
MKTKMLLMMSFAMLCAPLGAQATPRMLDDTSIRAYLFSRTHGDPERSYYEFSVQGGIYGDKTNLKKTDAIIVNWKKGGKTLASQRCPVELDDDGAGATFNCKHDQTKLTADGKLQVEILYFDDRAERKSPLKTLNINVSRWYYWTGMDGRRPKHRISWQIVGDDLLGTSYLFKHGGGNGLPHLRFLFWISRDNDRNESNLKGVLRCTVNGKPLADDIEAYLGSHQTAIQVTNRQYIKGPPDGETLYQWKHMELSAQIYWGPPSVRSRFNNPSKMVFLSEKVGAWACKWRVDGKNLREFRFTVEAGDRIKPHPEQLAPNGPRLGKDVTFIETYFPTPVWDFVFNPAAIKATSAWGRPWANAASLAPMFGALPKAKGTAILKPALNAK